MNSNVSFVLRYVSICAPLWALYAWLQWFHFLSGLDALPEAWREPLLAWACIAFASLGFWLGISARYIREAFAVLFAQAAGAARR